LISILFSQIPQVIDLMNFFQKSMLCRNRQKNRQNNRETKRQ